MAKLFSMLAVIAMLVCSVNDVQANAKAKKDVHGAPHGLPPY